MKKLFKKIFSRKCNWCGKEKEDFYGDMCTDCMSQ
jgi:NMD protein affecting ribosome stability and mRNA decay